MPVGAEERTRKAGTPHTATVPDGVAEPSRDPKSEQLVLADGMSHAGSLGPQVVWEVVTLERRKTVLKADVDEQAGQYAREDECSEGVNVATWRPDN